MHETAELHVNTHVCSKILRRLQMMMVQEQCCPLNFADPPQQHHKPATGILMQHNKRPSCQYDANMSALCRISASNPCQPPKHDTPLPPTATWKTPSCIHARCGTLLARHRAQMVKRITYEFQHCCWPPIPSPGITTSASCCCCCRCRRARSQN